MSYLAWYQPVFTFRSLVSHFGSGTVVTDLHNEFGNVNNSLRYTYGENILVLPNHRHDNLEQTGREDDDTIKRMWFFEINWKFVDVVFRRIGNTNAHSRAC